MEIVALLIILFSVLGLQGLLFLKMATHKLDYKCEFSTEEAHEGDELFLVETVRNRKFLPVPWLKVDIHSSRWLDFAGTKSVIAQDSRRVTSSFVLKSYQKTTRRWKLKCLKRGIFTTENVTLLWGDPLGFSTGSIPVRVDARIVVYPEIVDMDKLLVPVNFLQGNTIVRRWIVDDPFIIAGAREYTPHDPMNRVHWQATAREGQLMVRKNDFTSQLSLTILLNIQSIEFEYKGVVDKEMIELGIKIAATLLDKALRMGVPVRLATNGCTIDDDSHMVYTGVASGKEHISGLLKILSKLELQNLKDFEDFVAEKAGEIDNNEVVIITSYLSEGISELARNFIKHGNAVKIILLDSLIEGKNLPGDLDIFVLAGT